MTISPGHSERPRPYLAEDEDAGRYEDVGREVDHEVEHVARQVGHAVTNMEGAGDRAVDAIDDQGDPEPCESHRELLLDPANKARKASAPPEAVKKCTR